MKRACSRLRPGLREPEQEGGVHGDEAREVVAKSSDAAAFAHGGDLAAQQRVRGGGAERNDEARVDQGEFPVQPPAAVLDLV
jgi:hypothetical protein